MTPDAKDVSPDLAARIANVDLNLLPPMLALLQERSVTGAARRMNLSQPAMSHTLKRLRRMFDDDLLVRSGQQFVLTPRASALVEQVHTSLNRISDEVLHSPAFDPERHQRSFKLSMTPSTAYVVSPLLLRIAAGHAAISFEVVDSRDPGVDVFADPDVDLALVADIVATTYPRRTLYSDRWVVVVGRGNGSVGSAVTVEDLSTHPHVAYRSPTLRTAPYIAMEAAGIHPRFEVVSANFLLIPMLVAGTNAIAVVQERLAVSLAERFDLRIHEFPLAIPPLGIDLIENPRMKGDSAVAWLTTELRAALQSS